MNHPIAPNDSDQPTRKRKYLQDILWNESIQAVKISVECVSRDELAKRLREEFAQNSATTRARHTTTVLSRYFPTPNIDQLPRRLLRSYQDDTLLADAMAVLLPISEPVIGRLIIERLHPLVPGSEVPVKLFTSYGQEVDLHNAGKIATRCSTAARVSGWIARCGGKSHRLYRAVNPTAALLILHELYAQTPRIVELQRILTEPVWQYLGFEEAEQVRAFCRLMEQKQLIARYARVDRLDQITTRYTVNELMERKAML